MSRAVVWFRRNLRSNDNEPISFAASVADELVPVFVFDETFRELPRELPRWNFLCASVKALDETLGGRLVIRDDDPAKTLVDIAIATDSEIVVAEEDFTPHGITIQNRVAKALSQSGKRLELVGSPYLVAPGSVRKQDGTRYAVFTPFFRRWKELVNHDGGDSLTPQWLNDVSSDPFPPFESRSFVVAPGEASGLVALEEFAEFRLHGYAQARDIPSLDATSRLSPHLRWGSVHPSTIVRRLGGYKINDKFLAELCWREFFADVVFHRPDAIHTPLTEKFKAMHYDEPGELFELWKAGKTGFPLIDAGMRQLNSEGLMHNRVRMVAASFLVKDLHIDWRHGMRYFFDHLIDADVASNSQGWQWVAGSGNDAAPFFRIFNPIEQAKKFDPDGNYVRRYIPELEALGAPEIFEPWKTNNAPDYVAPIVDHKMERQVALQRYSVIRAASANS